MTDPCLEAQKDVQFRHFAAVGAWMNGVAQSFLNCPTSTFSVGGFSSTGRDWVDDYQVNSSASTGLANFGLAAGIRVPFGGRINSEYCKSYAKSLSEKTANDMLAERRNYQLGLLKQCNYLRHYGVNLQQILFDKGNAFEDLGACRNYDPFVQGSVGTGPILDSPQTEVAYTWRLADSSAAMIMDKCS